MNRFVVTLLLTGIIVGGGWALYHHDQIGSPQDAWQLLKNQLAIDTSGNSLEQIQAIKVPGQLAGWSTPVQNPDSLRIASFNVQALNDSKLADEATMQCLVRIVRTFDILAIQEISSSDSALLQKFVTRINEGQFHYAFAVSPLGAIGLGEQSAFIFNQATVRMDDSFSYTVQDPQQVLDRPPFVGWFRAAQPRPDRAFTFTLVNVHFSKQRANDQLQYLPDLFRTVRKDGRGEDDVIILGDFQMGDRGLLPLGQTSGLTWAIKNKPTDTAGLAQWDNLLFDERASIEFTGEAGVFDFLKHYNLSLEQAINVSDHMPVWAEFSIIEGVTPGRVARDPASKTPF